MDESRRRRDGAERRQHPKGNKSRRPWSWHRGAGEAWRWLAAVGRVDAARMCEQLEDWPAVADAVVAAVPPGRHHGGQSAVSAAPQQQRQRGEALMSVQHGGWAGNSTQLPRRRRPMTEDRRAAFEELLRQERLDGYEHGMLRALARDGTPTDQERARKKLRGSAPAPRLSDKQMLTLGEKLSRALNDDWDW
jgi:hypothetical protein